MAIKWGILGTGGIARTFTEDLLLLGHDVVAVGSRAPATAEAFAAQYGIGRAYGSYAELAADDRVDVVYVATTHNVHHAAARTCLEAGRGVLVEKPFTTTGADAEDLAALARERGLFAMEAMWTRFNPLIARLRELVADGAIGEVKTVYADFSENFPFNASHRLWAPELAGGALLDLGVYPLSFAWMVLGEPDTVQATTAKGPTGVDANTGILLGYGSGAVALLHCGLLTRTAQTADRRRHDRVDRGRVAVLAAHRADPAPRRRGAGDVRDRARRSRLYIPGRRGRPLRRRRARRVAGDAAGRDRRHHPYARHRRRAFRHRLNVRPYT